MTSLNKEQDTTESIKEHSHAKLVKLLYDQTVIAIYVSFIVGIMVFYILWDVINHKTLIIWVSLIFFISSLRLILVKQFKKKKPTVDQILTWDKLYLSGLFLISLTWGMAGWFLMPADLPLYQAFISFILLGMAGGAVGSYNARFKAVLIMEVTLLLPMTAWLLIQNSSVYNAMAFGVFIFILATLRATRVFEKRILESFRFGIELEMANESVRLMANTDELTKLHNRRSFFEISEQIFNTAKRYKQPLSLVMIDIDKFKPINDTKGHIAGDKVLIMLAKNINDTIRTVDITGRFGGDEFSILLPETTAKDAALQIERLRQAVTEKILTYNGNDIVFTCSFGVAELEEGIDTLENFISKADQALYQAKDKGGNFIVTYEKTNS